MVELEKRLEADRVQVRVDRAAFEQVVTYLLHSSEFDKVLGDVYTKLLAHVRHQGIVDLYGARYLRKPTWYDIQQIYEVHSNLHGLPGMIGSLGCRHWQWYNCSTAWRGQHTRADQDGPTIILQAVASQGLWVWSAYFGVARSCNDINVFEQSPFVEDYISGRAVKASFYANGSYYPHGYYLCDGIYPKYSIVVKTFRDPYDEKRAYFEKVQEFSQKDIERCFGVLQQR
ncbi:uncharacterized protein LOC110876125 [Helianthus annuus]|uniref:uncharacterized protein LOC110876125 n=1 Tax=Helianthus annuus TaxID=4232 RepID=UPI000B8FD660|nr:uncharacterized protein LOC110876125 [Helianthus annuus]